MSNIYVVIIIIAIIIIIVVVIIIIIIARLQPRQESYKFTTGKIIQ